MKNCKECDYYRTNWCIRIDSHIGLPEYICPGFTQGTYYIYEIEEE